MRMPRIQSCRHYLPFLVALTLVGPLPAAAQTRIQVAPAGSVTWDELLQVEARLGRRAAAAEEPRAIPFMPIPDGRDLLGEDQASPTARAAGSDLGPLARPLAGAPLSVNFAGLGDNNTSIPPDTMGAVGPADLVVMVNTEVRIQDKAGGVVSTVSLDTFWTSGTGLTGNPFDPHVSYDSIDGRWIATVDANAQSTNSQVWFAISATDDPRGTWTFFSFQADSAFPSSTTWADFPGLGVNATWIAITNNMFTIAGDSFVNAKMWVIDKATALAGGPLTTTIFDTGFDAEGTFSTFGFALKPAVTYSAAEPNLYIVDNTGFAAGGTPLARVSRITGTGPSPAWSVAPGSTFAGTGLFAVANDFEFTWPNAPQAGTATTIDAGDFRASPASFRNGRLWFAHAGGLPNGGATRSAVFWYQIDPTALPSPITQSGVLDGGSGVFHTYPSIAANSADGACIGFSRASSSIFIEAVGTSRSAGDAAGTMDPLTVIKAGEDSYVKDFGSGNVRWGDYSGTSIDPDDDSCWTLQEYAEEDVGGSADDDRWGTWWARFGAATTCGNGEVQGGEQCDDGNVTAGDGCSATCTIEAGFECSGAPTVCVAICGDGLTVDGETCDDGNTANGDCCSSTCQVQDCTLPVTADSFLRLSPKNTNEGANEILSVRRSGSHRPVLQFDALAGKSLTGLQQARLVLTVERNGRGWGPGRPVDAHALLQSFAEGNGMLASSRPKTRGTGPGVTWNCATDTEIANKTTDCSPKWTGGDFVALATDSVVHTNATTGTVTFDVTADVIAGRAGWLVKKQDESSIGKVEYFSREGAAALANPSLAPRIELDF